MVFTEIDKEVIAIISTLVKYSDNTTDSFESIISVGQYLGVPKDETLGIIEEWEEEDILCFRTLRDKTTFINEAFEEALRYNDEPVRQLHLQISRELGISA